MSYLVVYGWKNGVSNKKFLGVKPCGSCGKFTEHYLAKTYFRITLFWILPIFQVNTGKYLRCAGCDAARKLTRAEWKEYKEAAKGMPKKKDYLKAYEELKNIVIDSAAEDIEPDTVYSRLMEKMTFTDEAGHIRKLVEVYLENSRNAAMVATDGQYAEAETAAIAEANAIAEADVKAVEAAETETAEQPQDSKKRLLWLIPAILLLPIALILAAASASVCVDPTVDVAVAIIALLLFAVLPLGLFFVLAFKKKKAKTK